MSFLFAFLTGSDSFHRIGKGIHNPDTGAKIVRVLWHPLSVEGASLVVLTDDGYIRSVSKTRRRKPH